MHERDDSAGSTITYRVTVRGHLSERFCAGFEGLRRERAAGDTALVGELRDASSLYGLIQHLGNLGLELVRLERLP